MLQPADGPSLPPGSDGGRGGAFLDAAGLALDLVGTETVRQRWEQPSALPRMTIGMLACHLGRQVVRAREILPVPAVDEPLPEPAEHYRRAAWVSARSLDDPAMDRGTDERDAAAGFSALVDRCRAAYEQVRRLLEPGGGAAEIVTIPWQGWSLTRDDFLLTRLVEIVVHTDDLAHSLGEPAPRFPDAAYRPVLHLLADLAAERHGQSALIGALARAERRPDALSAF